jgi:hypothetical protein
MPMPSPLVMQQDMYVAIRTDNPSNALGTWEDPFDGSTAAKFDTIMSTKISAGQCVRLLPGIFETTGHSGTSSGGGWAAQNGVRILGSGMEVTTLKLVSIPTNATRYAVGMNFDGAGLSGFELSDLKVDCNLGGGGTGVGAGAVRVHGKNVYARRVKVIAYGTKQSNVTFHAVTIAGGSSENCVLDDCTAEPPNSAHSVDSKVIIFAFEGISAAPHYFCVMRNCAARGATAFENPPSISSNYVAATPGTGLGTIIEGNQFANFGTAILSIAQTTRDLIIQNNHFRNVRVGVHFNLASENAVGRIVAIDNMIELSRELSTPIGFELFGNGGADRFNDVVLRKNIVGQIVDTSRSLRTDAIGIYLRQCTRVIAENNILNDTDADAGVDFQNCGSVKFFNNQTSAGELRRGHDTSTTPAKQVLELEDQVQDVLLPI